MRMSLNRCVFNPRSINGKVLIKEKIVIILQHRWICGIIIIIKIIIIRMMIQLSIWIIAQ